MKTRLLPAGLAAMAILLGAAIAVAADDIGAPLVLQRVEASYAPPCYTTVYHQPAQPDEGRLKIGVNYTLWIPEGLRQVRGIIVHQHGCGAGAAAASVTAAHDLHWRQLAARTQCALLGPSFHLGETQDCALWCDPRNGSADRFLIALQELAEMSSHPEIATVPWCLWGHSGGGFWASLMQVACPERIVAIWFQSGTAFGREEFDASIVSDEMLRNARGITRPSRREGTRAVAKHGPANREAICRSILKIPMMANPGRKEETHARFCRAWSGCLAMFECYRARGAPIGFAPDPKTGHETGDSRYLAIPFFEACLRLRLPDRVGDPLKPIDPAEGWLAPLLSTDAPVPAKDFPGDPSKAVWLPDRAVARAWQQFVKTGTVDDVTPPPAPTDVRVDGKTGTITWKAEVDFESGLQAFLIERDGRVIGQVPEEPRNRFGRPLFQGMTYGDTPELPLPAFRFVDAAARNGQDHEYRVIAVNSAGLRSP